MTVAIPSGAAGDGRGPGDYAAEVTTVDGPLADVWDAFVEATPGGDLVQSAAWGRTKTGLGFDVLLLALWRDGRIAAGAQMVFKRLPLVGSVAYVARGPVVAPGDAESCGQVVHQIGCVARSMRLRTVIVQPPEGAWPTAAVLEAAGYEPWPFEVAPSATILIDLRASPDEILASMGSTRRRHFRRAARQPIEIVSGPAAIADFARLHAATAQRQGFAPLAEAYLRAQWDELAPHGRLEVFVARVDGDPVAGIWVTAFGDRAVFRLSGWAGRSDYNVNEACHWAAMTWARSIGCDWYDLGGFHRPYAEAIADGGRLPADLPDRWSHLRFKASFGGQVVLAPAALHGHAGRLARMGARVVGVTDLPIVERVVGRIRNG